MLLGISDNGDADTEERGQFAFRDRLRRVVSALRVNIGPDFAE
jgi:hypothetical protein